MITGKVVEIPSKTIVSLWPLSKFTYLLITGSTISTNSAKCSYVAGIWNDGISSVLNSTTKSKEEITGYYYPVNTTNEFIFTNTKDQVIEIKCL